MPGASPGFDLCGLGSSRSTYRECVESTDVGHPSKTRNRQVQVQVSGVAASSEDRSRRLGVGGLGLRTPGNYAWSNLLPRSVTVKFFLLRTFSVTETQFRVDRRGRQRVRQQQQVRRCVDHAASQCLCCLDRPVWATETLGSGVVRWVDGQYLAGEMTSRSTAVPDRPGSLRCGRSCDRSIAYPDAAWWVPNRAHRFLSPNQAYARVCRRRYIQPPVLLLGVTVPVP